MEEKLDLILNNIQSMAEGQAFLLKLHYQQTDKIDKIKEDVSDKFNSIMIGIDKVLKQNEDIKQELSVMQYRQQEHSDQLENYEVRISKLEGIE